MPKRNLTQNLAGTGVRYLRINADQTTDELSAAQMLAAVESGSKGRASLAADVTRTGGGSDTLSNTGLSAITFALEPSSHYALTYRLYMTGTDGRGIKLAFDFPASLPQMDGGGINISTAGYGVMLYPDWPNNAYGPGDASLDSSINTFAAINFTFDIRTGSTAGTFGDFSILFAESVSGGTATMRKNSCVEWRKF